MTGWHDETFELDAVLKGVEDPEPAERSEALKSLIKNAPETALVVLERLVREDPERSIRLMAATELERLKAERASGKDAGKGGAESPEGEKGEDGDEEKEEAFFEMRKGPPRGVPRELRWVIRLDWAFAALFGIYAILHVVVPLIWGEGVEFYGSPVRFAAGSTSYNLIAAILCYAAARDYWTQGLAGSVIQLFAALAILPSFPAGPVVGAYMIYKVLRPVPKPGD